MMAWWEWVFVSRDEILNCVPYTQVTHLKECPSPVPVGDFSAEFRDFVARCLHKDKDRRDSAIKLMDHPWITSHTSGEDCMDQLIIEQWIGTLAQV